jgi:hypothetical protein
MDTVTDRSGHPLTVAQQIRQTVAYEPVSGERVLANTSIWPHEQRIGLATRDGTLVHTWRITSSDNFQSLWPQAVIGNDVVDMGTVAKPAGGGHYTQEFLVVRISPAGRVLDQLSLDESLSYNWGDFTRMRVGPLGVLISQVCGPRRGKVRAAARGRRRVSLVRHGGLESRSPCPVRATAVRSAVRGSPAEVLRGDGGWVAAYVHDRRPDQPRDGRAQRATVGAAGDI